MLQNLKIVLITMPPEQLRLLENCAVAKKEQEKIILQKNLSESN